jgi:hypothetical protein
MFLKKNVVACTEMASAAFLWAQKATHTPRHQLHSGKGGRCLSKEDRNLIGLMPLG